MRACNQEEVYIWAAFLVKCEVWKMELTERLIHLRKEQGLTQQQLAERLEVSRQAVSRWELGEAAPTMENLRRLSGLYGVPLSHLLDGEEPEKAAPSQEEAPRPLVSGRAVLAGAAIIALAILGAALLSVPASDGPGTVQDMEDVVRSEYVITGEDFDIKPLS